MLTATLQGGDLQGFPWEALVTVGTAVATTAVASNTKIGGEILNQACSLARSGAGASSLQALVDPKKNPSGYAQVAKYVTTSCSGVDAGMKAAINKTVSSGGSSWSNIASSIINKTGQTSTYPIGSITSMGPNGQWMVATPGAPNYLIIGSAATNPPGVTVVDYPTFQKMTGQASPWYKTTLGMIGIGVGVLAVGFGVYKLVK